jgi:hypothetical protein
MIICFQPGKLSEKPDTLTWCADYYLKRGDRDYMLANPQNLCPVFMQEQPATSLHTTLLHVVVLDAAALVDSSIPIINATTLTEDIKSAYLDNLIMKHKYNSAQRGVLLLTSVYLPWVHSYWITAYTSQNSNLSKAAYRLMSIKRSTIPNHQAPQL